MSKSVVLTGGATGIGSATVDRLIEHGHQVMVLDVTEPPEGSGAEFVRCDLGEPGSIDGALAALPDEFDALVNVAGIATAEPKVAVVAVNFLGLRYISEAVAPRISAGGTIVNVASSAGRDWRENADLVGSLLDTGDFESGMAWLGEHEAEWAGNPYKFSKQAAAAYTYRAAGLQLSHGVRVNCVNPGAVETRLTPEFRDLIGSDTYDWIGEQLGRTGSPDEVAEVVEFLAVGDCRWLNGVEITVDGGYFAGVVGGWIDPESSPRGGVPPSPLPSSGGPSQGATGS